MRCSPRISDKHTLRAPALVALADKVTVKCSGGAAEHVRSIVARAAAKLGLRTRATGGRALASARVRDRGIGSGGARAL